VRDRRIRRAPYGELGIPLAIHVLMPKQGRDVLIATRDWMARENATFITVLSPGGRRQAAR
jgi:hypothetical protein